MQLESCNQLENAQIFRASLQLLASDRRSQALSNRWRTEPLPQSALLAPQALWLAPLSLLIELPLAQQNLFS